MSKKMEEFLALNFPYRAENKQKLVVVGLSGGVDSSVAAALLKAQGFRVIGLFMKNWEEKNKEGVCTSAEDFSDVVKVCEVLDIPYYAVEFVQEYWDHVFSHFLHEYSQGRTPNPDVLCNKEIKFKAFFDKAMHLGADYLATGHYAQTVNGKLYKGLDPLKDQSYFLYAVKKEVLEKVLFPVGGIAKKTVRELAKYFHLPTQDKKDSTGICFIGERDFRQFLNTYIQFGPGYFKNLDGSIVGKHVGVPFYTLGQRKGLGLGGVGSPWFVVAKDFAQNIVYVERGEDHPALFCQEIWAQDLEWVNGIFDLELPVKLTCKIRYRQVNQDCEIVSFDRERGIIHVRFPIPQRAATPGQSIVFYQEGGSLCLGGGVISRVGESLWQQKISKNSSTKNHHDSYPEDLSSFV